MIIELFKNSIDFKYVTKIKTSIQYVYTILWYNSFNTVIDCLDVVVEVFGNIVMEKIF